MKELSDHSHEFDYQYEEILKVAKELPENVPFLEIGTRSGGSALLALKAIQDSKISRLMITVDPYGGKTFVNTDRTTHNLYPDSFHRKAMYELSKYAFENDLEHVHFKLTSFDFIKIFDGIELWRNEKVVEPKFGYVYLDGEHNEVTVEKELEYFLPRMVKGGLIVIDDTEQIKDSQVWIIKEVLKNSIHKGNRSFFKKEESQ